ncbi:MAG: TetR/AcrR family transcriptional regulator [Flavobacteriaceae bacterium]|nr:TetR/AcrR family transcriptional regulator [Flavobacteriaceae bacterium]
MKTSLRKQEIINKSAILFKEKGYSAVTMRDIATVMGMKAASLYNHIKSKQEILSLIILSLAEQFTAGMDTIVTSEKTTLEKLQEIIILHIQITSNNPNGMASLNANWMHLEEKLDYYFELRDGYEDSFRAIIIDGIKKNEISDVNPEVLLFSMLSTLRSLYLWIPKKDDVNIKNLDADLSKVLLEGVVL